MDTMRAMMLDGVNMPFRMADVPRPVPISGEALVRMPGRGARNWRPRLAALTHCPHDKLAVELARQTETQSAVVGPRHPNAYPVVEP